MSFHVISWDRKDLRRILDNRIQRRMECLDVDGPVGSVALSMICIIVGGVKKWHGVYFRASPSFCGQFLCHFLWTKKSGGNRG